MLISSCPSDALDNALVVAKAYMMQKTNNSIGQLVNIQRFSNSFSTFLIISASNGIAKRS